MKIWSWDGNTHGSNEPDTLQLGLRGPSTFGDTDPNATTLHLLGSNTLDARIRMPMPGALLLGDD